MKRYLIEQLDEIPSQQCPCGTTRRAFVKSEGGTATTHLVDISADSRVHYHKRLTEIYVILEGEGQMQLDDDIVQVSPMTTVMIQPECRHRAIGQLKVLVIAIPAFNPDDEWFDG